MSPHDGIAVVHHSPADSSGRPVLLIHGFASDSESDFGANGWIQKLADADFRVSTVDLPGHGRGPEVASIAAGCTTRVVDYLAAAVDEAADFYGVEDIDVLGYSLGARLAWELPAAGARVGKLVLGGLSAQEPFALIDTLQLRHVVAGNDEAGDPLLGMMAMMVGTPGKDTDSLINLIGGLGSEPFAPGSTVPATEVLFVAGEDDFMTAGIEEVVGLVAEAELRRVPGDHRGALDSPEFHELASGFLLRSE